MKTLNTVHALAALYAAPCGSSAAVVAWQDDFIVRGNLVGADQSTLVWAALQQSGEPLRTATMAPPLAPAER